MQKHFRCKFIKPKDFLGLDLTLPKLGELTLSMRTFTAKMLATFNVNNDYPGDILTPERTDEKIVRGEQLESNDQYRSKVGSLNWLTMGVRYDIVHATKELSRVLSEPTKTANNMLERALLYVKRTQNAYLSYSSDRMHAYKLPLTRKKPTDVSDTYNTDYNVRDEIVQEDEKHAQQAYLHPGPPMHVVVQIDCDLAGQIETRQTTTSLLVMVQGALVHWRASTERIIIPSTAAGDMWP
jgi:hypothetical protein